MHRITRDRRSVQSRLERALRHAAEDRAAERLMSHIDVRERIAPLFRARCERAADVMGLLA